MEKAKEAVTALIWLSGTAVLMSDAPTTIPGQALNALQLENVKRIKAFHLAPTENGLTIIGGRNGQGKTSVLDSIAWALGGEPIKVFDMIARENPII